MTSLKEVKPQADILSNELQFFSTANTTVTGYSYNYADCRAIKKELVILEDHLCFHTTFFAWLV